MRFIIVALAAFFFSMSASAQSFQVRPLLVEGEVSPGVTVEIPIRISPTDLLEERLLEVQIVQLAQSASGAFRAIEYVPGDELFRSSAGWITAPSSILLDPPEASTLTLTMDVPASARGTYAAGVLLIARPPEDAEGLRLTVRVLVPIILGMDGRIVRQDVRLADATLRYRFPEPENPAEDAPDPDAAPQTTFVDTTIENRGGTFSQLGGNIWVDAATETGEWRQIRRLEISNMRLLPETAITLPVDIGRLLPGGNYRIRGELRVDGRRTAPLTREVTFEGHPAIENLLQDITLPVEPSVFQYTYAPGATRSGVITVENPAINPIEVTLSVGLPSGMEGRASAEIRDTDISAVDWISVQPNTFRLRPGEVRNIRILARFPQEDAQQQHYFAEILADARYLDGQQAGSASVLVEVSRSDGASNPAFELSSLQVSQTDSPMVFALSLRGVNTGDTLLQPEVAFALVDVDGRPVNSGNLDSEIDAPIPPLVERAYGGTLNVEGLPAADYVLLVTARHDGTALGEARVFLSVDDEGGVEVQSAP